MKNVNETALKMLQTKTIIELVEMWEEIMVKEMSQEIATTRGWILTALEEKNPVGMDKYYDGFYEDEELRNFVL